MHTFAGTWDLCYFTCTWDPAVLFWFGLYKYHIPYSVNAVSSNIG